MSKWGPVEAGVKERKFLGWVGAGALGGRPGEGGPESTP